MKKICVLMGANNGAYPEYMNAAVLLGKEIARRGHILLYGGGKLGLMGVLADAVLENGGKVVGIITSHLYTLEAHLGLSDLQIVETMQERKVKMINQADLFLVLPGGLGTLEEIFEIWNAAKIGLHRKPIGILNTNKYYDKLIEFVDLMVQESFLKADSRELISVSDDLIKLLDCLIDENNKDELMLRQDENKVQRLSEM